MSTLWTPDGERPVGRPAPGGIPRTSPEPSGVTGGIRSSSLDDMENSDLAEQVESMQKELANTPAEAVMANHCYGMFELAAVYLSQSPPLLPQACLAIDALASLVDGLAGRLGESEAQLKDGLNQLRLAYVQIDGAQKAGEHIAAKGGSNGAADVVGQGGTTEGETTEGAKGSDPGAESTE